MYINRIVIICIAMASSSEEDAYGPPLPPGFKSRSNQRQEDPASDSEDEDEYGPALPPHLLKSSSSKKTEKQLIEKDKNSESDDSDSEFYGPALPQHLQKNNKKKNEEKHRQKENVDREVHQNRAIEKVRGETDSEDDDMYGPALPPHLMKKKNSNCISSAKRIQGPTLPPGFIPPDSSPPVPESAEEEHDNDDDRVSIGPMPSAVAFNEEEYRIQQLELRAKKMKDKLEGKCEENKPVKRETWMLELPEDKPNFCGLAPRQFRKKAPQEKGDRSVWTDSPADKAKKATQVNKEEVQEEITPESIASRQRDDDLTERVDKYNKEKRSMPLIDLHKKKMKKIEESAGPKERRPFSREEDLNVNKFDDAQKSNILKKARQLNDRFSAGGKKFL